MKLKKSFNFAECPNCHQKKLPHRICTNCGFYDGKAVIETGEE